MADRSVTQTEKNTDGDITALCNQHAAWSPRLKQDTIDDINSGTHTYYVLWTDNKRTEITVVNGPHGQYLRTDRDQTTHNNLADLPDC